MHFWVINIQHSGFEQQILAACLQADTGFMGINKTSSRNRCKLMSCNASKGITNNVTQLWGINLKLYHSNSLAWHFYLTVQCFFWGSQIKLAYDYTHLLQSKSRIVEPFFYMNCIRMFFTCDIIIIDERNDLSWQRTAPNPKKLIGDMQN